MNRMVYFIACCSFVASLATESPIHSQTSALKLGSGSAGPGATVTVPIYWIADDGGDPVQAVAVKLRWSNEDPVTGARIERAGSTATLQPIFETTPSTPTSIAWVAAFEKEFDSSAPDGAVLIAVARITLAKTARPGSIVSLLLDPQTSVVGNREGTRGASVGKGNLRLVDGLIRVVDGADKPQSNPRGAQR